jgi:VWFA-related protein
MKKTLATCLLVGWALGSGSSPALVQDSQDQAVTVTAVEVPVRVYQKGEFVKNLTREDFEVYENGVRQEITAFEIRSKTIAPEAAAAPAEDIRPVQPRLFILIFNVYDYNQAVGDGIDYFIKDVFRRGDRLVVVVEDKILNIRQDDDPAKVGERLKEALKNYKSYSTFSTTRAYSELSTETERVFMYLQGNGEQSWYPTLSRFYTASQRIWDEYKRQFFSLDLDLYRSLIQKIKAVPGDKWVLCFEQRQLFPRMKKQSQMEIAIRQLLDNQTDPQGQVLAQQIKTMQLALQRSMDIVGGFPGDRLRDLFMQAGFTFHLIMLKSPRTMIAEDYELTDVGQDYEACYRRISEATGGAAIFSGKIAAAIQEASAKEDYSYLLVYQPKDTAGGKERKIDVKVARPGVEVVSLKQYVPEGKPLIAIADFKAEMKSVRFNLKNYTRVLTGGKRLGAADIRVVIFDDNSKQVFADHKTLELAKDETNITLNFPWIEPGSYFIVIDAYDRITAGKDVYSASIRL